MQDMMSAINEKSTNSFVATSNTNGDYKRLFEQKSSLSVDFSPSMNTLKVEQHSVTKYPNDVLGASSRYLGDMNYIFFCNNVLRRAVWNLVNIKRFHEEHIDLLDDYVPVRQRKKVSQEYKKIAMKYVSDIRDYTDEGMIAHESKILLDTADVEMTSDEIGDILNIDTLSVEFALAKYSKKEAVKLGDE